ncbi:hypothetical protein JMM81_17345 [Bacillus sp. V3B]|uniref:hypothetical protein n=1 Tax=Bacillus sp. V3B TaxID=2804915 RepID=UPI00210C1E80|nr:hypothetical protein [Bacillus sp. V3B]MCQ6276677.1 hypothetical protein [Bacillus sp. V3B]
MVNSLSKNKRIKYSVILYLIASLIMPFAVFNFLNIYLWNISFNPVDFILKPFILIPVTSLLLTLFIEWTRYLINSLSKNKWIKYSVILYLTTNLIMTFAAFNFLNVYLWNISFNPVDFILKPFILIPVTSLLLTLFIEWTGYAFRYTQNLSLTIRKTGGILPLKIVKKSLPICIIDESYFNKEFQIKNGIVVDMRIKDNDNLSFSDHLDVVKLYNYDRKVNIPHLIEKANLLIKNTALKNKPITFIVDSKKEKNRTISRIWLRLIRNPKSKSAKADIHTILTLVY